MVSSGRVADRSARLLQFETFAKAPRVEATTTSEKGLDLVKEEMERGRTERRKREREKFIGCPR